MQVSADRYANEWAAAPAPDGSTLAFVGRGFGQWWRHGHAHIDESAIMLMREHSTSKYEQLTDGNAKEVWPMWGEGGKSLFYTSDRGGAENIWKLPLGGKLTQLTKFTSGRVLWPSISYDGRTIVFERGYGIWRMETDSGRASEVRITLRGAPSGPAVERVRQTDQLQDLALAPDGKKVAFVVRGEIFADFADKETDREQRQGPAFRVTNTSFRESDIAWSSDSRRLVYPSDRHGDEELYLYDFATRAETRLTDRARPKAAPSYSPDGTWIAYVWGDDEIRLLNPTTREDRPFVRGDFANGTLLAWSPDSRWLAFVAQDARQFSNLYIQAIDADAPRQITFLSNIETYWPLWAPNGRFIIFTTGQYRAESQIARLDLAPTPPLFREAEFEKLFQPGVRGQGSGARGQGRSRQMTSSLTPGP